MDSYSIDTNGVDTTAILEPEVESGPAMRAIECATITAIRIGIIKIIMYLECGHTKRADRSTPWTTDEKIRCMACEQDDAE